MFIDFVIVFHSFPQVVSTGVWINFFPLWIIVEKVRKSNIQKGLRPVFFPQLDMLKIKYSLIINKI